MEKLSGLVNIGCYVEYIFNGFKWFLWGNLKFKYLIKDFIVSFLLKLYVLLNVYYYIYCYIFLLVC